MVVAVPCQPSALLTHTIQGFLTAGSGARVYRLNAANGGTMEPVDPPTPPGHWTNDLLVEAFLAGETAIKFLKVPQEKAALHAARLEVGSNHHLSREHGTEEGPRVKIRIYDLSKSSQRQGAGFLPGTPIDLHVRQQEVVQLPPPLSHDEQSRLSAILRVTPEGMDLMAVLPVDVLREFLIADRTEPGVQPNSRETPEDGSDNDLPPSLDDQPSPRPSSIPEAPSPPDTSISPAPAENPLPLPSSEEVDHDPPGDRADAPDVPTGYPWPSLALEQEDRRTYQAIQRKSQHDRSPEELAWLREFRTRCRAKRSLEAASHRDSPNINRKRMQERIQKWQPLLAQPQAVKRQATDRRIDAARQSRQEQGRSYSGEEERRARDGMRLCEQAMNEYARKAAERLEKLREGPLPIFQVFPTPIPTRKGHQLLAGEVPEATVAIHQHLQRKGITRPMIDLEFSAPEGFLMSPQWAQYLAIRIATRLGVDPSRVMAASHDPDKERSKRRPGEPVKSHAHVAIPVAFPDGSYLHVPHLPAILQAELATVNYELGLEGHVAIAMRGRYAQAMHGGPKKLFIERRFDPTRYTDEQRRRNGMDLHGTVKLPLSRFDRDVAAIPFPSLEHITCPAGVAHVNVMSEKRRRAAAGDQRRHEAALKRLKDITRKLRQRSGELNALERYLVQQTGTTTLANSRIPAALKTYFTGNPEELQPIAENVKLIWRRICDQLAQELASAEHDVKRSGVELALIYALFAYLFD